MQRLQLAALILAASAAACAESLPKSIVERVTAACVLVQAQQGEQAQSGSGFFVSRTDVLTNYHVVKAAIAGDARLVVVIDGDKKSRKLVGAALLGADEELDLALLRADHRSGNYLRFLRESDLRLTLPVWVAGFPFGTQAGLEVTLTAGTISSLRKDEEGALRQVQIDAAINPGNSGGPVVNDKGQVVGVTQAVVTPKVGAGMAIAIPCCAAEKFVQEAQRFRRRTKSLRLIGRASRRGFRVVRAEKVLEPWGVTVELTVRGSRGAEDAESFEIEITDRRREVLKRQTVLVEELTSRDEQVYAIRLRKVDFDDITACHIVD